MHKLWSHDHSLLLYCNTARIIWVSGNETRAKFINCAPGPGIVQNVIMPFILVITDASTYRYEVHFQKSMDCGGAYIKLLSDYDGLRLVSVIFL